MLKVNEKVRKRCNEIVVVVEARTRKNHQLEEM